MRFGKSILSPSYVRNPDFNSYDSMKGSFKFECLKCQQTIEIFFNDLIGKEFSWHNNFDENSYKKINEFYDINAVNKTHDGGWTAIDKCFCESCQTQYLIYASVNEYSNSCYKITLQAITEILDEPN